MSAQLPIVDLQTGSMKFNIVDDATGTKTPHEVDVMLLKLACEEQERTHNLEIRDGKYVPTPQFLFDLANSLKGLGLPMCTPTMAFQLWCAAGAQIETLKKNTETPPT
ncbi:MAG: hypothetical protein SFX18_13315 [Pirellulales bacterium]|nr:hypothetical protein [Pirellulales bacterium]